MGARFLTDLPDVIAAAGLPVVCVDGWETRANKSGGFDRAPVAIVQHHTAGSATGTLEGELSVLVNGNSSAPGPIAQLLIWRDGIVYVVAAGRCNHAGSGSWPGISSMNSDGIGIEKANDGVGEIWPAVLVDHAAMLTAALVAAYAIPIANVIAHREWAPDRKVDPRGPWEIPRAGMTDWATMDGWRAWVAALAESPVKGDDMACTLYELTDADAVFVGLAADGVGTDVSWCDAHRAERYRAIPTVVRRPTTVAELESMILLGPLPANDGRHRWDGSEFYAVIET